MDGHIHRPLPREGSVATTGTLGAEERREHLSAALARDGSLRLETAAAELGVSAMTIRRDLLDMEAAGLLRRVRGGAMPPLGPRSFRERSSTRSRAKSIIAEKAVRLVPTVGAVALDASSTVGTVGARIGARPGLLVATNSYESFRSVLQTGETTPVLIGGEIEPRTDSFVGSLACRAAESMLYRRFFTSASAMDAQHGSSEVTLAEAQVKHAFARSADETVLCVDSSKLEQRDVALCLEWSQITVLVTELEPADRRLDPYRELTDII